METFRARSPLVANHTYYSYGLTTFREIDLLERIRKINEAQRAVFFSTEEARHDIRLLVMSESPRGISNFGPSTHDLNFHSKLKSFQETLDIFQHKFEGGAASGLEVARAQAAMLNVKPPSLISDDKL